MCHYNIVFKQITNFLVRYEFGNLARGHSLRPIGKPQRNF